MKVRCPCQELQPREHFPPHLTHLTRLTYLTFIALIICSLAPSQARAGGSGLNVIVVINRASTNSLELGNYYCEQRQVPPQNVLYINWTGGNITWDVTAFLTNLYQPVLAMLAARQLTNQADYVVLSMDIPYAVSNSTNPPNNNSTTSALFYGYKLDSTNPFTQGCSVAPGSTNLYAGSESIFRATPPISPGSNSFLVTMITTSNLALAKQIVDSGVASDSTFPTQPVLLIKGADVDRNVRYVLFDNAVFDTRLRGNYAVQRADGFGFPSGTNLFGGQTGEYYYGVYCTFAPGALADNMTSYGGLISGDPSGQLNMLALLAVGGAGGYGTVSEPCNYLEKFPSPQNYLYQARGFSLAECYYQSVTNPYQGLLVGEPLAAPFAQPASGAWLNLPANSLLSGTTNLSLRFTASDAAHPIQQVDLFLDGLWFQTLTNLAPQSSNVLYVTLNGFPTNYAIPASATIKSIASNLTASLNATAYSNATKVAAAAHGDRIELRSVDFAKAGAQVSLSASNSIGTGSAATTFINASRASFLDTVAYGIHNLYVTNGSQYPPAVGAWLQLTVTKTNGSHVIVGVTNSVSGTTIPQLVSALISAINANAQLALPDGCVAQDFIDHSLHIDPNDLGAEFNLAARTSGWGAATLQADLQGSAPDFLVTPGGPQTLTDNLPVLQPRNHLYITAGTTNLPVTFPFHTSSLADGYHELTAVTYEGSHVRTQKRISQTLRIQNTSLSATFTTLVGDSNSAVEATLQFSVVANTNNISQIELFSTGGSLGVVPGQAAATFSVSGTNLGVGLHPFYAVVTTASGTQYRTETKWIRLLGPEPPFAVSITAPPPTLSWSATAGRSYEVLTASNLSQVFQLIATLIPSNSAARWTDSGPAAQRFYRVRPSP